MAEPDGRAWLKEGLRQLKFDAGDPSSKILADRANARLLKIVAAGGGQVPGEVTQQQVNDWLRTGTPARYFDHLWVVVVDLTVLARNAGHQYPPPSDRKWRSLWKKLHQAAQDTPAAPRRSRTLSSDLDRTKFRSIIGRPLEFDGVDVGLQVLVGTLGLSYGREDVHATPLAPRWAAPTELLNYVSPYAERNGLYPGEVARLNKLDVVTYSLDGLTERHRLRLEMAPTTYFDAIATNMALGPFTPDEAPLLNGRSGIEYTRLSNLVQIELVLTTTDGYVPVFKRAQMAFIGGCWQISSGETLQLPIDLTTDGRPDVFKTAVRGLHEEAGLSPDLTSDLAVLALVATPEFATIGVLMRGTLNCTAAELANRINRDVLTARDNWEHTGKDLVPINHVPELARALTDRRWTKQSAAAMIFAHAEQADGNVTPLARAITAAGGLNLEEGSPDRNVVPVGLREELVRKYIL